MGTRRQNTDDERSNPHHDTHLPPCKSLAFSFNRTLDYVPIALPSASIKSLSLVGYKKKITAPARTRSLVTQHVPHHFTELSRFLHKHTSTEGKWIISVRPVICLSTYSFHTSSFQTNYAVVSSTRNTSHSPSKLLQFWVPDNRIRWAAIQLSWLNDVFTTCYNANFTAQDTTIITAKHSARSCSYVHCASKHDVLSRENRRVSNVINEIFSRNTNQKFFNSKWKIPVPRAPNGFF